METGFVIISGITVIGAVAAMSLRRLVHCALCLVLAFSGLAAFYLRLDAQFVGFAQILVYVGAVAILIVFAILLTRSGEPDAQGPDRTDSWSRLSGVGIALLVFVALCMSILSSSTANRGLPDAPTVSVEDIGRRLMTGYVLPLEVIALLLTAAMLGAVLIAMREEPAPAENGNGGSASAKPDGEGKV